MKIHVVQLGDTLSKIAKKHDVDLEALKKVNKQLTSPDSLKPGMKVKVPTGGVPVKKKKAAKEAPKYKKEAPKMNKKPAEKKPDEKKMEKMESKSPVSKKPMKTEPAGEKEMKKEPVEGKPMNGQPMAESEPPRPDSLNLDEAYGGVMPEDWGNHYPMNNLPGNWPGGGEPQVSGAYQDPNANPMMHPGYVSPASFGPNANHPMMPPQQVSPASYGPNANPMYPQQVSPASYGPNANPMYPQNVSPAYYHPHAMPYPANPGMNTMPMAGSKCGCGGHGFPQGVMPMQQGPVPYPQDGMHGAPYVPPMPEMEANPWQSYGMPPQMSGGFQPEYWEPNNDSSPYGMMPADENGQRNSNDQSKG